MGPTVDECGTASPVIDWTETIQETITPIESNPEQVDPATLAQLKTQLKETLSRLEKVEPKARTFENVEQAQLVEKKLSEALGEVKAQIAKMGKRK